MERWIRIIEQICAWSFSIFCNEEYVVETGNHIAQLIVERCFTPKFVEVSEITEEKTERGQKGFGLLGV